VLDKRIMHKRPTIATTASTPKNLLAAGYSKALLSRLSMFRWISLPSKDWREQPKKESEDTQDQKRTGNLFDKVFPEKKPEKGKVDENGVPF